MKKLMQASLGRSRAGAAIRSCLLLLVFVALALLLWNVTTPVARARELSPTEMLESMLPENETLAHASKPDVLRAVCAAIRKYPKSAAQIVRVAVAARKSFSGEIVGTAAHCLDGNLHCDLVVEIVVAAMAENPDYVSAIMEQALIAAPDCRGAIQGAVDVPGEGPGNGDSGNATSNGNPGGGGFNGGGGGFNPEAGRCQVCHTDGKSGKRMTLTVSCNAVPGHLGHGDTEGPCPVTPTQNP